MSLQNVDFGLGPSDHGVRSILKLGAQRMQIQVGYRTYLSRPVNGPDWGLRLALVLLFPK